MKRRLQFGSDTLIKASLGCFLIFAAVSLTQSMAGEWEGFRKFFSGKTESKVSPKTATWVEPPKPGKPAKSFKKANMSPPVEVACSGNASTLTSQAGVTNPNNALGAADGSEALLWETADQLVLQLADLLDAGASLTIRWRKDVSGSTIPSVNVETSGDGSTFTGVAGSPFTVSATTLFDQNITSTGAVQYVRITTANGGNLNVDAISYTNAPCTPPTGPGNAACVNATEIGGIVFRDYNANGVRDNSSSFFEAGMGGVVVDAYDADDTPGNPSASVNSNSDGTYLLTGLNSSSTYRLEFSWQEAWLQPGAAGGTSVQFATPGSCNHNFGVNNPADYCQSNPTIVTNCYVEHNQISGSNSTLPVLVSTPYDAGNATATTTGVDTPSPSMISEASSMGSTWGLAYQRLSNSLFVSAFMKRHSGMGPDTTGAIYKVNTLTNEVSTFLDFNALFGAGTAGDDPHPFNTPTGDALWQRDANSWDAVGKVAFGDLDISEDELHLWAINLANRKLYKIPLSSATNPVAPGAGSITAYPASGDLTGIGGFATANPATDIRPFGLGVKDGFVYVGFVSTAESTQSASDLRAYVYRFDPDAETFTKVLDFPLDYPRGHAVWASGSSFVDAEWRPWATSFTVSGPVFSTEYAYPQPILSDIVFENGNMILGFRDRFGDQMGYDQLHPTTGSTLYRGDSAGDLLKASPDGSGGWTIEQNAQSNPSGTFGPTAGAGNNQGPATGSSGEFYHHDRFPVSGSTIYHDEVTVGGLLQIPGLPDVATTQFDPVDNINTAFDGGIFWMSNSTGNRSRGYRVFDGGGGSDPYLGKANGLGDLEALCDAAPIEVGNRIWMDADNDGIQDSDETGIDGVTVKLFKAGFEVASTTTAGGGLYGFSNAASGSAAGFAYNVSDLTLGMDYEILIEDAEGGSQQGSLSGLFLTIADNGGGDGQADLRDSDGSLSGTTALVSFTTGNPGDNRHIYDFGFGTSSCVPPGIGFIVASPGTCNGNVPNDDAFIYLSNMTDADQVGLSGGETYFGTDYDDPSNGDLTDGEEEFTDLVHEETYTLRIWNGSAFCYFDTTLTTPAVICQGCTQPSDITLAQTAATCLGLNANNDGSLRLTSVADGDRFGVSSLNAATYDGDDYASASVIDLPHTIAAGIPNTGGTYIVRIFNGADDCFTDSTVTVAPIPCSCNNPGSTLNESICDGESYLFDGQYLTSAGTYADTLTAANGCDSVVTLTLNVLPYSATSLSTSICSGDSFDFNGENLTLAGTYTDTLIAQNGCDSIVTLTLSLLPTYLDASSAIICEGETYLWQEQSLSASGVYLDTLSSVNGCDSILQLSLTVLENEETDLGSATICPGGSYDFNGQILTAAGIYMDTLPANNGCLNFVLLELIVLQPTDTLLEAEICPGETYPFGGQNLTTPGVYFDTLFSSGGCDSIHYTLNLSLRNNCLSLGDLVFEDVDNDGTFNIGDNGIEGVQVQVWEVGQDGEKGTSDDEFWGAATTSNSGNYLIQNLPEGLYFVKLTGIGIPAGYVSSTGDGITDNDASGAYEPYSGTDDDLNFTDDGTQMGAMVMSDTVRLIANNEPIFEDNNPNTNRTVDFGLYLPQVVQLGSLGDFVWFDENGNGQQNITETGVTDVVVELWSPGGDHQIGGGDDTLLDTDTTDINGFYIFYDLPEGEYFLQFDLTTLPANYLPTTQDNGADLSDSDANALGTTEIVSLEPGETNYSIDFGIQPEPASLGDYVWFDLDHDGQQDGNETGVPDVNILLFDLGTDGQQGGGDDNFLASTTTDLTGHYLFGNLLPGDYYVQFDLGSLPAGYFITLQDNTGSEANDSDADTLGTTSEAALGAGESNLDFDLGIYDPAQVIFDLALRKRTTPGQQQYFSTGDQILFTVTVFNQGNVDAYDVQVVDYLPAGLTNDDDNWIGGTGNIFTEIDFLAAGDSVEVPLTVLITGTFNQYRELVNYAEISAADNDTNLGNTPPSDIDSDADTDPNNDNGGVPNSPTDDEIADDGTTDEDDHDPSTVVVIVPADPDGYIYCDKTGKIVTGGTISVTGPGAISIVKDGSDGSYQFFTDGTPGTYSISYSHPNGYPISSACPGQPDTLDLTVVGTPYTVGTVTLDSTGMFLDTFTCADNPWYEHILFGLDDTLVFGNNIPVQCVFIGSIVCEDTDHDDVSEPGDPGFPGMTVYLYDCADTLNPIDSIVTNALGEYAFDGLTAGDYRLQFVMPGGSRPVAGSNVDGSGFAPCISLAWSECDTADYLCVYACPTMDAGTDVTICYGDTAQMQASMTWGSGAFSWSPGSGLSDDDIANPLAFPTDSTQYIVSYDDGLGCNQEVDSVAVNVLTTVPYLSYTPFILATVECDEPRPFDAPVFADSCDNALTISLDSSVVAGACDTIITRTWTATNAQGNSVSFVQTVNVIDTVAPVITASHPIFGALADGDTLYVDCSLVSSFDSIVVNATDNCSAVTVDFDEVVTPGDCPVDGYVRLMNCGWTASDVCGNLDSLFFTVIVTDTVPPVILASHPSFGAILDGDTLIADCSQIASLDSIGFSSFDNCGVPTVTFWELVTYGNCPVDSFVQSRYCGWTSTDSCGNTDSLFFTVLIFDNQPPALSPAPADTLVHCEADIPPPAVLIPSDLCDTSMVVTVTQDTLGDPDDCFWQLQYTWSVSDDCGNSVSVSQFITISDTLPPTIDGVPADTLIGCNETLPPVPGGVTASDNCGGSVLLEFSQDTLGTPGDCSWQVLRTWTATDDCGNVDSLTQVITMADTIAPGFVSGCQAVFDFYTSQGADCPASGTISLSEGQVFTQNDNWTAGGQTVPNLAGCIFDDCSDADSLSVVAASILVSGDSCTRTFTVRFDIVDECGNVSDSQFVCIVNLHDDVPPTLSPAPADTTVACMENIPPPAILSASDDCTVNLTWTFTQDTIGNASTCLWQLQRTWEVSDSCGNSNSEVQIITIQDTISPVLNGVPADITVECDDALPPVPAVTATDNCLGAQVTFVQDTLGNTTDCTWQVRRTWTATDACGNQNSDEQIIYRNDQTPPVLAGVPADSAVMCGSAAPAVPTVTATDNCDLAVAISYSADTTYSSCGYEITRTWIGEDNCGNRDTMAQIVLVGSDTIAPVIAGVPADTTVYCDDLPPIPGGVTVSDNCTANPILAFNFSETGGCPNVVTRIWTAVDDCGNLIQESYDITLIDTLDPVITPTHPALVGLSSGDTMFVECGQMPSIDSSSATFSDACCANLTIDWQEFVTLGDCNTLGYLQIMNCGWVVEDCCGNLDSFFFYVVVSDNTPPDLSGVPADATVECDDAVPPAPPVFAVDNCDQTVPVGFAVDTVDIACGYQIVRTWTATDDCGNSNSDEQIITVADTTAPVISGVPAEMTWACDAGAAPAPGGVSASDNCDADPSLGFVADTTYNDCGYVIERTWTATDSCGNSSTATQTVTVTDTVPPTFDPTCQLVFEFFTSSGSVCPASASIGLTVGQEFNQNFSWTVGGESIPSLAGCLADNCSPSDSLTVRVASIDDNSDSCDRSFIVRFDIMDECGNVSADQFVCEVIFHDDTAPIFTTAAPDTTIYCNILPAPASMSASDNCDPSVTITFDETQVGSGCPYTIERTWTASDGCGNQTVYTQTLTVTDTVAPNIYNVPANTTADCGNLPPVPGGVVASDDCDASPSLTFSQTQNGSGCSYQIIRTWTATDTCGNTNSASQIIDVTDDELPSLTGIVTEDTINCGDPLPPISGYVASDNCDTSVTVNVFLLYNYDDPCDEVITRIYQALDDCGNQFDVHQHIHVRDNVAPVITPTDPDLVGVSSGDTLTFECTDVPVLDLNEITITELCSGVDTVFRTENLFPADCATDGYYLLMQCGWTAIDSCGNVGEWHVFLRITDTTPPVIAAAPADVTVQCGNIPPLPPLGVGGVTATDVCDDSVSVTVADVVTGTGCPYTIERTWTATDHCGNTGTATQIITVTDTVAPVLAGLPAATLTAECGNVPQPPLLGVGGVTATDDCDTTLTVDFDEIFSASATCPDTIWRTWVVYDDCGNADFFTQTILVDDTTPPAFDLPLPADATVQCDNVPIPAVLTASDLCDSLVSVVRNDSVGVGCPYQIFRTWTATDDCGNEATHTQILTVTDTVAPTIAEPTDATIYCGNIPAPVTPAASDNCDFDLPPTFDEQVDTLVCGLEILRTWTFTDDCGNSTTVDQLLILTDTTAPALVFTHPLLAGSVDGDTVVQECHLAELFDETSASAVDSCSSATVTFIENGITPGFCPIDGYIVIMHCTWVATDACGNETSATLQIRIEDNTPPEIAGLPADTTIQCNEAIPPCTTPTVSDLCGNATLIGSSTDSIPTADGYDLVCSWLAMDDCGNVAADTQVIHVETAGAPILSPAPPDTVIYLADGQTVPTFGIVVAIDACTLDTLPVQIREEIFLDSNGCDTLIVRTWFVEDNGDTTSVSQTITVIFGGYDLSATTTPDTCGFGIGSAILTPDTLTYAWSDGGFGDSRFDLTAGTYTVIATNDNGCADTLLVTIGEVCPCLPAVLDSITTAAANCGVYDGSATLHLAGDEANYEYLWIPNLGTPVGDGNARTNMPAGSYIVFVTWQGQDTCVEKYNVEVYDNCPKCAPVFQQDILALEAPQAPAGVCLPVPLGVSQASQIYVGGSLFTGNLTSCDYEDAVVYDYSYITGAGQAGLYDVSWAHDGVVLHTLVNNVDELAAAMNAVAPAGNWLNNPATKKLVSTHVTGNYGKLSIGHVASGEFWLISKNKTTSPMGTRIVLPAGEHQLVYSQNQFCKDTLLLTVTLAPLHPGDLVSEDLLVTQQNCDLGGDLGVCIEIPYAQLSQYDIELNGADYQGQIGSCDYLDAWFYTFANLPGSSGNGSFELKNWTVNGQVFSGSFQNMAELIGLMNAWDTHGTWSLDVATFSLKGGSPGSQYGSLKIFESASGTVTTLELNSSITPGSTSMLLTEGIHQIVLTNLDNGVKDTLTAVAACVSSDYVKVTLKVGEGDTLQLPTDELYAQAVSLTNTLPNSAEEAARVTLEEPKQMAHFFGRKVGETQATLVLCDKYGICDTTYVTIEVRENFATQLIADTIQTVVNQSVTTDVVANDRLAGDVVSNRIIQGAQHGTVEITANRTVTYTPSPDYCNSESGGELDHFYYEVCLNDGTCHTMIVYVEVLCDELVIHNGFSPNGDGVNDYFKIDGLHKYPNHKLTIFNRWGNLVFKTKDYRNDWGGSWGANNLPVGTYFYLLEDGEGKQYKGYLQIRR